MIPYGFDPRQRHQARAWSQVALRPFSFAQNSRPRPSRSKLTAYPTSEWTAPHSKSPVLDRAFLIPLRPASFSAKVPLASAARLQAPSRRCQPFVGYQAHPFQSKLTALPTRQRAGAESYSRLFPLPRTCVRIQAGLNGPSFPNKKAPGRVPYLYDPGAAGECIFMRWGSEALLRAGGQQVCAVETGKKAACSADSVMAIRRGKFHQRFRPVSSSGWR